MSSYHSHFSHDVADHYICIHPIVSTTIKSLNTPPIVFKNSDARPTQRKPAGDFVFAQNLLHCDKWTAKQWWFDPITLPPPWPWPCKPSPAESIAHPINQSVARVWPATGHSDSKANNVWIIEQKHICPNIYPAAAAAVSAGLGFWCKLKL